MQNQWYLKAPLFTGTACFCPATCSIHTLGISDLPIKKPLTGGSFPYRYMVQWPGVRILRRQELDAFLAQALSPKLYEPDQLQELKVILNYSLRNLGDLFPADLGINCSG